MLTQLRHYRRLILDDVQDDTPGPPNVVAVCKARVTIPCLRGHEIFKRKDVARLSAPAGCGLNDLPFHCFTVEQRKGKG